MTDKEFQDKLNNLRTEIRLTAQDLTPREKAEEIGIGFTTLYRVLRGEEPSLRVYLQICEWIEETNQAEKAEKTATIRSLENGRADATKATRMTTTMTAEQIEKKLKLTKLERFVKANPDMPFDVMATQLNRTWTACEAASDRLLAKEAFAAKIGREVI